MPRINDLIKTIKDNYNDLKLYLEADHGKRSKSLHKRHSRYFDRENQQLLTGTAIVVIILIIVVSIGYYYAIYSPNMQELETQKTIKTNEVNRVFKDNLSDCSTKQALISRIDEASSIEDLEKIDVASSAYPVLKNELLNQISTCSDKYHRVEVVTNGSPTIMSTTNATNYINSISTDEMVDTSINIVDTVIIPVNIDRKQAASGLITQGDTVDIYTRSTTTDNDNENSTEVDSSNLTDNTTVNSTDINNTDNISQENNTNETPTSENNIETNDSNDNNSKLVGGATVISILRSKDSGSIDSEIELSEYPTDRNLSQASSMDIEEIMSSKAAGTLDESQLNILLNQYGWRLSDYERTANLGDLDVEYIIMLEVPRSSVESVINNMENIILTIPTSDSPSWVNITT